ncbi:LacI family DNA-binding transcriptional regulator [Micromonospora sp. NPDC005206]|uniref:LacI family DNA-binding transcriptional regulator n=1 Tax=Micromonospora sp. NPDC005206 TaxID=3157022 RepID=UPI0033A79B01
MPGANGRATQADVARVAGVSQATVSLILNGGDTGRRRAGEQTRRRVLDAIRMTGYVANPAAQRLAGGRTRIIGVFTYEPVFPRDSRDFYHPFLVGVEAQTEELGCDLLFFTSTPSREGRRLLGGGFRRLGIADGCVLLGRHDDKRDLADLLSRDFPFAFIGRRESDAGTVPYVGADYVTATREVVERLFALGHERVGFVGDLRRDEPSVDRAQGYHQAVRAAGSRPVVLNGTGLTGGEALDLIGETGLTAAVVWPSGLAPDIRAAALARGKSVPGDLSLAQLGDVEDGSPDDIDWTGFRIPREQMGAAAVRLLFEQLVSPTLLPADALRRSLPCTIVPGATTGAPARTRSRSGGGGVR